MKRLWYNGKTKFSFQGFVHLACLKTWIMHRRDNHCEICNAAFGIQEEKLNLRRMMWAFCSRCACPILKHLLFGVSLLPLIYIILQQLVICMDNMNINPNQELTAKQVAVAFSSLMTSSNWKVILQQDVHFKSFFFFAGTLLFYFFEFMTTRIILIRNILRHWWAFGNSSDFALIHIESEVFD